MKDFLMQWLAEKKPTLKDGTYKSYEGLIKTELIPNLGEKHIDQITRKEIQEYLFRIVEQRKNRTAQKVRQLLGAVFTLAVEDYDFKNPMTKIKLPHYEVKKGSPLSKAEEKQLIEFCKNNPHLYGIHSLLVLLYKGGIRKKRKVSTVETDSIPKNVRPLQVCSAEEVSPLPLTYEQFRSAHPDLQGDLFGSAERYKTTLDWSDVATKLGRDIDLQNECDIYRLIKRYEQKYGQKG